MPTPPTMKKRPRQPKRCVIQNSGTLRKPRPTYCPTEYMAFARARSCCGNQVARIRLLAGKQGASNTPTPIRVRSSAFSERTTPISAVKSDQKTTAMK